MKKYILKFVSFCLAALILLPTININAAEDRWYVKRNAEHKQPICDTNFSYIEQHGGIFVDKNLTPQKVRIRVYGSQVEYLRTLPLHKSQEEVLTKHHQYSDFQYRLCLTPELTTQILSMGNNAEVLEPQELREKIKEEIQKMSNYYN